MILQIIQFLMVITGTIVGVSTMAGRELQIWIKSRLERTNSFDLFWGATGTLLGLVTVNLFFLPMYFFFPKGFQILSFENKYFNSMVPFLNFSFILLVNLLFAFLGITILFRYKGAGNAKWSSNIAVPAKLIDTSSIIDGRFSELLRLGFLEGKIIVPKYVLNELQLIADSSDPSKRNKGKSALELLFQLRKERPDQVCISEDDFVEIMQVDAKLVKHAKTENARLITHDYNLKRIAELEDVRVLNLNDLVNALKPIALSGEEVEIQIIKPGKESGQGVGYLTDGTMVVVENGGPSIGKKVVTVVTNILQTSAGRMIFSRIPTKKV
ncbi:TRAM domain-containing protein [bacterium]|nr:TRAM domain-containing protein [bacterium]